MTALDAAMTATYVAPAAALGWLAYLAARLGIAAIDSEAARRRRTRRADGITDIERRAYAVAFRDIHRSTR